MFRFLFSDTMGFCFLCDEKLLGEKTRVSSSVTPHSNVPFPEKIAELLGEEFVVIVTPTEYMCKTCTSLLTHVDKLENDLSIVKTALKTYIQKKYKILPANQSVMTPNVIIHQYFCTFLNLYVSYVTYLIPGC